MKRILYIQFLVAVLAFTASCGDKTASDTGPIPMANNDDRIFVTNDQFKNAGMTLGNIEERSFPVVVNTTGMIDVPPENRAVVNATMGGYIKTTPLLTGDIVRKGQALVTLENPDFVRIQQEFMEVSEQLRYLKSEFERHKAMIAENITSQKNYLQAESAYKTAIARHSGLSKQLTLLNINPARVSSSNITSVVTIYAPISGSITQVHVTRGSYVSPASPILEIIDNKHIHIELSVFEKDVLKLKKDQKIIFKIPEVSTASYTGQVYLIGSTIHDDRTIKVHGHIDNELQVTFLPGMFVDAGIVVDSAFAKALPEQATVNQAKTTVVLKLDSQNDKGYYFKKVTVKTTGTYDGFTALTGDDALQPTDKILTTGAFNLIADE